LNNPSINSCCSGIPNPAHTKYHKQPRSPTSTTMPASKTQIVKQTLTAVLRLHKLTLISPQGTLSDSARLTLQRYLARESTAIRMRLDELEAITSQMTQHQNLSPETLAGLAARVDECYAATLAEVDQWTEVCRTVCGWDCGGEIALQAGTYRSLVVGCLTAAAGLGIKLSMRMRSLSKRNGGGGSRSSSRPCSRGDGTAGDEDPEAALRMLASMR
ncbi:hypothetical protein QBC47DRAFT_438059, partial [Echria macrotheca]